MKTRLLLSVVAAFALVLSISTSALATSLDLEVVNKAVINKNLIIYTITVKNYGPDIAQSYVEDVFKAGAVKVRRIQTSQGSCSLESAGSVVFCYLGDLAKDLTATIQIEVIPSSSQLIENTAYVSSYCDNCESNLSNNSSSAPITPKPRSSMISVKLL